VVVGAVVERSLGRLVDLADELPVELDEQLAATESTANAAMPAATRRAVGRRADARPALGDGSGWAD
jgi:hypothetical protein